MESPDNLKAFNYITLQIFNRLYEAFPEPINIKPLTFIIECVYDEGGDTENTKNLGLVTDTVTWLGEEGFLSVKDITKDGTMLDVRLSLKGLTVLGYIPTAIEAQEKKKTIIEQSKEILAKGAKDASAEGVKTIVSSAFKLMLSQVHNIG